MFSFVLGTLFGLILGMVLNHAIEESERRKAEAERLRSVVNKMNQERWNNGK